MGTRTEADALDVNGYSNAMGASIIQWPWYGGYNQQWSITKQSSRIENSNATFSIHPNPAKGTVQLTYYKKEAGACMLSITNMLGKVVLQKQLLLQKRNNNVGVDVSSFKQGVYFVNILIPFIEKQQSIKLIIK